MILLLSHCRDRKNVGVMDPKRKLRIHYILLCQLESKEVKRSSGIEFGEFQCNIHIKRSGKNGFVL